TRVAQLLREAERLLRDPERHTRERLPDHARMREPVHREPNLVQRIGYLRNAVIEELELPDVHLCLHHHVVSFSRPAEAGPRNSRPVRAGSQVTGTVRTSGSRGAVLGIRISSAPFRTRASMPSMTARGGNGTRRRNGPRDASSWSRRASPSKRGTVRSPLISSTPCPRIRILTASRVTPGRSRQTHVSPGVSQSARGGAHSAVSDAPGASCPKLARRRSTCSARCRSGSFSGGIGAYGASRGGGAVWPVNDW